VIAPKPPKAAFALKFGIAYFASPDTISSPIPIVQTYLQLMPNGENAEAARQLIAAAKAAAPPAVK